MRLKKISGYYLVRLQKGEEIISTLKEVAQRAKIKGAFYLGLGVGKDLVLGYFDAARKSYLKKAFAGEYEFTSFVGNITKFKKETVIHCHVTVTDADFGGFGGHLFHGVVPVTLEIVILPLNRVVKRRTDPETGLNLLDI